LSRECSFCQAPWQRVGSIHKRGRFQGLHYLSDNTKNRIRYSNIANDAEYPQLPSSPLFLGCRQGRQPATTPEPFVRCRSGSELLHVSQPSISVQLKQLEEPKKSYPWAESF
jgi:hypothetical protein